MKDKIKGRVFCRNRSNAKHVIVPDGVVEIADFAFSGCDQLYGVTLPNTVTAIGHNAFKRCENLRRIVIPEGVSVIGTQAFSQCVSLLQASLPSTLQNIAGQAFAGCTALAAVRFLSSEVCFAVGVFAGCVNLTEVRLPPLVKEISHNLFYNCQRLEKLVLPNSITSIQYRAFYSCHHLRVLTLPPSVTNIGDQAFKGCTELTQINIPAGVVSFDANVFAGCDNVKVIAVCSDSEIDRVKLLVPPSLSLNLSSYYHQHQMILHTIRRLQMGLSMPFLGILGMNYDVQKHVFLYVSMKDMLALALACQLNQDVFSRFKKIVNQPYFGYVPKSFGESQSKEYELLDSTNVAQRKGNRLYHRDLNIFKQEIKKNITTLFHPKNKKHQGVYPSARKRIRF